MVLMLRGNVGKMNYVHCRRGMLLAWGTMISNEYNEKEKVLCVEETENKSEIFPVHRKIFLLPPRAQNHITKPLTSASHNQDDTSQQTAGQTYRADQSSGTRHHDMVKCAIYLQHT
ncbi:hypothetical protein F4703DRAFT_1792662 [Phycomyces blakesleeanus]